MSSGRDRLISTPEEMFSKLENEFKDFNKDTHSSRAAMNFVLTAYHLKEWVWKGFLKNESDFKAQLKLKSQEDFNKYVNDNCPNVKTIKRLANASKHFYLCDEDKRGSVDNTTTWDKTDKKWEEMCYSWDYSGLIIDIGDDGKGKWISALAMFDEVYKWWEEFLKN